MNAQLTPGPTPDRAALMPNHNPLAQLPLVLDLATMDAALADGTAIPLTSHVTSLVTYGGAWWLDDDDAWLQIIDHAFAERLNMIHGGAQSRSSGRAR
jgi:hypothetical protein